MSQQIAWTTEADGSGLVMSDAIEELTGMGDAEEARYRSIPTTATG